MTIDVPEFEHRSRAGAHVKCFIVSGLSSLDSAEDAIDRYSSNLATGNYCFPSQCLDEIRVVQAVQHHLERCGQDHMDYLVMFRCNGTIIAKGTQLKAMSIQLQLRNNNKAELSDID